LYGDNNNNVTQVSWQRTNPGTYRAYYRITAQGYEDYEGTTTMKIRFKTRDDMLKIDRDLGKTYDNVAYGPDAVSLQDDQGYLIQIDWKDPSEVIPYESLPTDRSAWKIEYFIAEQDSNGKWKKIGDALESVIDAGDYFYRLTIPAGDYYAETILERHFTIERRLYTIGNPADKPVITKTYDGLPWTYNIATNNDAFEIEGLLPNHKITVGTLYTNAVNVGVYNASNLAGNRVMMLFNSGTDYILWDSENNCDVRDNYRYEINVSIEILKADMNLVWPTQTEYYYPGPTGWITPVATLIVPNQYSSKIEYSIDGVKWRSEPYSFREVKDDYYKVTARVQNVPNYNNCEQDYFFKILKEANKLEMDDISRPYNGDPIGYPYIMTYGWTGAVNTNKDVIFKWLEYNEGTDMYEETANNGTTRPIEVGKYAINVTFPETDNYGYIAKTFYFEITKLVLTAQWANQNLTYNAEEQDLALKLTSNDYPSLNVLGMLKKDIDYTLVYTDVETGTDLPGKPKDVGHYKVTFTLKPIAYKNYEFADGLDFAYQYFDILKCRVVVSYTGVFNFDGNPVTITRSQLKIEGLPAIVDFQSALVTKGTGPGNFDTAGNYLTSDFKEKYLWTTSAGNAMNPVLNNISTGNPEVENNYEIYVNVNMRIASGVLVYSVSKYNGVYDGDYHSFDFTITPEPTDVVSWEYSVDGGANYTAELPKYKDAMASPVHIVVRVKSLLYGNPNNNNYLFLGDDPTASNYDEFTISIGKADTILEDRVYDLDKIYDAQVVQNPEIFYNGDKRNDYLHFDYYYMEKEGEGYQPVDIVRSRSVGEYKLIVWMEESPNYKGTDMSLTKPDETAPLEIIFKISPRVIVISMEPESKVYDGDVWSARLNSADPDSEAKFLPVVGIPESGLIKGHIFNGTVQTNGANADEYKTQGRFQMLDGWGIKDNLGVDVTRNYDVRLDLHVTIEEAQFDVTAENIERIYRKGDSHHIEVVFNTKPKVPCSLEDLITYYSPTDEEMANGIDTAWSDLSKFTTTNPEFESGFHTVYFIIEYPNYRTYYGQATVYIKPLTSSISVDSYKGKFTSDSKVYDGYEYETGSIEISMADGSPMLDRTASYEFYDSSKNKLSYIPIDVGTYYFRVHLSADSANIYEECWSEYCQFKIVPQEVEIQWDADIEKALADGSTDYQMIYVNGQMVLAPTPVAEDEQGRILDLEVTDENGDPIDSKLSGGPYWIVASLKHVKDQQNYRITNDRIKYKITAQPGGYIPGPPGGGPYPPFPPEPETPLPPIDGDYVGIVFKTPDQENMKTKLHYNYRDLMDEKLLYIEATFVTRNGSTSYVLTVDAMTGEVTEVNGYQVPSTGYFNFYFSIPMTKDEKGNDIPALYPKKTEIQAVLRDPFNTAWNTDGDTDPVKINLLIDPTSLNDKKPDPDPDDDPDNPKDLVPDVIVYEDSYEKTQIWSEWADQGAVTPDFTVAITNGTSDRSDDIILVKDVHYTVEWHENDHVSQSWERGYFVVKSIDAGGYEFHIGEYKPTEPNPYQYGAGSFQIISSLPNRFEIINGSKYVFEKFEQDFTELTLVTTILSNEDRTTELDGATSAELAASMIRLSHTYQGQSVWWMLEQLINKNEDIVVYDALGDVIFEAEPGSTESLKAAEEIAKAIRITSGMKLALFKNGVAHTTENQLDVIEVVLKGDIDQNGYVDNNDILAIKDYIIREIQGEFSDPSDNTLTSSYYQSALLSDASSVSNNDILKIKAHAKGESISENTI
ncbi:MAG: hypothetical protein K2K15_03555, partial [Anaeroplasmataceae bacterium]|nr:hypothetical protein [Anaeroplasmataceae bacterium]